MAPRVDTKKSGKNLIEYLLHVRLYLCVLRRRLGLANNDATKPMPANTVDEASAYRIPS